MPRLDWRKATCFAREGLCVTESHAIVLECSTLKSTRLPDDGNGWDVGQADFTATIRVRTGRGRYWVWIEG
jgi:hypothetical protein